MIGIEVIIINSLYDIFKFLLKKEVAIKANNIKIAICGLTIKIKIIPNIIINLRSINLKEAHKIKLTDIKIIESFPNPEDQKLIEGRNIIIFDKSLILLDMSFDINLRLASSASKPMAPNIPNKNPIA